MPPPARRTRAPGSSPTAGGESVPASSALRPGEILKFEVGWGPFGNAGEIIVAASEEMVEGFTHLKVTTSSRTRGIVRTFYKFESKAEAIYDRATGRLLAASETTRAGRKRSQSSIVFDYAKGEGAYTDHLRPKRNTAIPIPEGPMLDLLTALVIGRVWTLQPGDERLVNVLFDDEFYDVTVRAERREKVKTDLGTHEAVVMHPVMENNPRGLFKRGGSITVWLGDEEPQLPVKLEVKVKVGTATATLVDYVPPVEDALEAARKEKREQQEED